ncbi:MAG TPA: hypothetical protein VMP08_11525, partial [Anaerolineae bacterium]|nr:hypothetical protein [Anaerolineae bacterium]
MATRPSNQANIPAVKRGAHKQKPHRTTFTRDSGKGNKGSSGDKGADLPPDDPLELNDAHHQYPWSFSLNNLVRLDWSRRQRFFPHGPGSTFYDQFTFHGQTYTVESLNPKAIGDPSVILLPEVDYYTVPIYEEGQAADAPARLLLIQNQVAAEECIPHIVVVEPPEPLESDNLFAHLHIIGGETNDGSAEPPIHIAGMVEAILTI